jgi:putative Mn2+ efflux pump MntP
MAAVLTLSVGLAMDATAVAAARGFSNPDARPRDIVRMGALFGGFQAAMPIAGWAVGSRFARLIAAWDHWVAFVLLAGIGVKMIYEVVRGGPDDETSRPKGDAFGWMPLLALAVATSIDALVAGLTLPLLGVSLAVAVSVIGLTTAAASIAGAYLGRRFGTSIGRKLDVFGGVLLIGLGLKIVLEHG